VGHFRGHLRPGSCEPGNTGVEDEKSSLSLDLTIEGKEWRRSPRRDKIMSSRSLSHSDIRQAGKEYAT